MDKHSSGVYTITNAQNGNRYVGQARCIAKRWTSHLSQLRRGAHHCQPLQRAWLKYGAASFLFEVLENTPDVAALLCEREQFWMDTLKPAYNVNPIARPGWTGMTHGAEAKRKISESKKTSPLAKAQLAALHAAKRGVPRKPETIAKMRAAKAGFRHSAETIEKLKAIAARSTYRHSPEIRERMRAPRPGVFEMTAARQAMYESRRGQPITAEHKAALLRSLIGHAVSAETRAKIGAANKGKRLGTKHSEETKAKIGAAHLGRKRPDVSAAKKGVPRTREDVEAIRAGHLRRWAARAAEIKAALLANPTMSITKIAASIGADRETVSKYRKELQCQPPQPSANASDASESQNLPARSSALP